jgi:hypothetical protein
MKKLVQNKFCNVSKIKHLRKRLGFTPLEKVAKRSQRPNTVADDLGNRQHGHREDRARNTPHPEPEDERDDDEDGIEGEPSGQSLALDSSRKQESYRTNGRSREFSSSRTRGPSSPAAMSDGCSRNGAADS